MTRYSLSGMANSYFSNARKDIVVVQEKFGRQPYAEGKRAAHGSDELPWLPRSSIGDECRSRWYRR